MSTSYWKLKSRVRMKACPIAPSVRGPERATNNVGQKAQAATHKSAQDTLRPCLCNLSYHLQVAKATFSDGLAASSCEEDGAAGCCHP